MTRIVHNSNNWWLHEKCASDSQAIIGGGFGHLHFGTTLLFSLEKAEGSWLKELTTVAAPTVAAATRVKQEFAAAYGFTAEGLIRSGLDSAHVEAFGVQFNQGMTNTDRIRQLGDKENNVLNWSGGTSAKAQVHFMLLLYAKSHDNLIQRSEQIIRRMSSLGVKCELEIAMTPLSGGGIHREHFGFADGVSQPIPVDQGSDRYLHPSIEHKMDLAELKRIKGFHAVNSGDFLFGRLNSYEELAPSPFVPEAKCTELSIGRAPNGFRDFGYNGTYLVVRQLEQNVAEFWKEAKKIGNELDMTATEFAERVVGRTMDGELLTPTKPSDDNNQGFYSKDLHGTGCPLGSHVRRANPRDGAATASSDLWKHLKASNNHRILRRGRNYGPEYVAGQEEITETRGLMFMCINTDIRRQFEFIQETWLNSVRFANLNATDPLVGHPGSFTLQDPHLRKKANINTYVTLKGGDYFFLPSLSAINFLTRRCIDGMS